MIGAGNFGRVTRSITARASRSSRLSAPLFTGRQSHVRPAHAEYAAVNAPDTKKSYWKEIESEPSNCVGP